MLCSCQSHLVLASIKICLHINNNVVTLWHFSTRYSNAIDLWSILNCIHGYFLQANYWLFFPNRKQCWKYWTNIETTNKCWTNVDPKLCTSRDCWWTQHCLKWFGQSYLALVRVNNSIFYVPAGSKPCLCINQWPYFTSHLNDTEKTFCWPTAYRSSDIYDEQS